MVKGCFLGLGCLYQRKRITAKLGRERVSGETGYSGVSPESFSKIKKPPVLKQGALRGLSLKLFMSLM